MAGGVALPLEVGSIFWLRGVRFAVKLMFMLETRPPAGWYPDPDPRTTSTERWWNGEAWTVDLRPEVSLTAHRPVPASQTSRASKPVLGWLGVTMSVLVGAGGLVLVVQIGLANSSQQATSPAAPQLRVTYEVDGTASTAGVTASTPTGTEQHDINIPLTNTSGVAGVSHVAQRGEFLYLSAQNQGSEGTITCRITLDGEVVSENSSSGEYGIASCEFSVP